MITFDPGPAPGSAQLFGPAWAHDRLAACEVRRQLTDVTRRRVTEVRVGEASYYLRYPITLTFYPFARGGVGELRQEPDGFGIELNLVGRGVAFERALSDWKGQFHTRIQTLLAKREWERTAQELEEMATFERLVDIPAYLRDTPYRVREIGTVRARRLVPDRIKWEDGRTERVALSQMPPEFASLHAGQRFEAITLRTPATGKLVKVVHVSPLPRLGPAPGGLWDGVRTSAAAPPMGWDEID